MPPSKLGDSTIPGSGSTPPSFLRSENEEGAGGGESPASKLSPVEEARLIEAARAAQAHAYAPYSGYRVGASVRDEQGRIHIGVNVENISYGLTICAERAALARMVADGGRHVTEVAVVTKDGGTPCGMCLQSLAEFAADPSALTIHCGAEDGTVRSFVLKELLPHAFQSETVGRTCRPSEGSI